ncbi:metalloprotease [Halobacteriales archaeon QH_10_67_13]|nr:MAG: metalloprotease [Halobacteriales archaeon QH_10_67_13]
MVEPLTLVLIGIVLYTAIALALKARGYVPESVSLTGPVTTIRTQRGRALLNRLARRERFWRAWGNIGVGIALVVMVLAGFVVALTIVAVINQPEAQAVENPQNVLVIPGVNDFLPLSAAPEIVFGLLVGLVVHEGGHGLLCRVENIEIDSMGIISLAFVPMGAFVEPDAADQQAADRGAQTRMFAAGITNNFAVSAIALLLLVPVAGAVAVAPGAPVGDTLPGSGAEQAGLGHGDRITAVDGTPVENGSQLEDLLDETEGETLAVERADASDVTVDRRLLLVGSVDGTADGIVDEDPLTRVTAVAGTTVDTEAGFAAAAADAPPVVTIATEDRGETELPIGALVAAVDADGPLADAASDLPEAPFVITAIDDRRILAADELRDELNGLEAGATVTVETHTLDGTASEREVALGDNSTLGVTVQDGYTGLLFDDFGVDPYPAENFLGILDGSAAGENAPPVASVLVYMGLLLVLPFATLVDPDLTYNFAGFTSDITSFFIVEGPLAVAGGGVLLAANLLFWTWWINLNLAIFNCIPALPLDGGHILRTSTASIISRLPVERGRTIVTAFTLLVTAGMLGALLVVVLGPALL